MRPRQRPGRRWAALWAVALLALAALTAWSARPTTASVIGIDLGTDWIKVSIVKTGVPLDIVLNRESKRKTPAVVTVHEGIRYFGSDALRREARFPSEVYGRFKNLLGLKFEDQAAAEYRRSFQNTMVRDANRSTVAFEHAGGFGANASPVVLTIEELTGMLLAHARQQAEAWGNEPVRGAVITVPPYFDQFSRQAVLDAARIAELPVFSLMNDETAVALNYATSRAISGVQHHLFYDMGAGSTVAALVEFSVANDTSTASRKSAPARSVPRVRVVAIGFDQHLGGAAFDQRLQQHFAKEFMRQHGKKVKGGDITNDARAMARLFKEANRVKQILSANVETIASVEGAYEELDFRLHVTRAEFEEMCADLLERVGEPVQRVLAQGHLTLDDVSSVVLVGGSSRIPKVQRQLAQVVGEGKMAQNINADEAAALGAGLQAARLSKLFRVRAVELEDISPFAVDVRHRRTPDGSETSKQLFAAGSALGTTRAMSFKGTGNDEQGALEFDVVSPASETGAAHVLFHVHLEGAESAVANATARVASQEALVTNQSLIRPAAAPRIKAQIELESTSGLVVLRRAFVETEVPHVSSVRVVGQADGSKAAGSDEAGTKKDGIGAKIWNFFSKNNGTAGQNDTGSNATANATELYEQLQAQMGDMAASSDDANATAAGSEQQMVRYVSQRFPLVATVTAADVAPLSDAAIVAAQKRQLVMAQAEEARLLRENTHNGLEALVYSTRDALDSSALEAVTTEEEREALLATVRAVGEWIEEEADMLATAVEAYREREAQIKEAVAAAFSRRDEHLGRPQALEALRKALSTTKSWLETYFKQAESEQWRPKADTDELRDLVAKVEAWLESTVAQQEALAHAAEPVLRLSDLAHHQKSLETTHGRVLRARRPTLTTTTSLSTTTTTGVSSTATDDVVEDSSDSSTSTADSAPGEGRDEL